MYNNKWGMLVLTYYYLYRRHVWLVPTFKMTQQINADKKIVMLAA
jgi:hypothetical protein